MIRNFKMKKSHCPAPTERYGERQTDSRQRQKDKQRERERVCVCVIERNCVGDEESVCVFVWVIERETERER